jgi:hypothetical protein
MTWSVDIWPSLQQIPERFEPLFADAGDSSLFAGKDWWALLEKHGFPDKQTTAYVAIERDNKPIMVCPLRHPALGEPGAWRSLSNYYSHSYAPLLAKGEAPEKLQRAFCELGKAVLSKGSPYPSLCLDPIWNQGNWAAPALRGLKAAGFATSWTEVDETWSINVIDMQPAQYYQQLPGKLRNTIERKTQQAEARGPINLELALDSSHALELVPLFEQVYAASWKQEEPDPSFISEFANLCAERDALRIGILLLDDEPIAAQLWVTEHDDTAILYKLAHDGAYDSLSPGTLLTWHMIEALLTTDSLHHLNFGRGHEGYKRHWMPSRQSLYRLQAFRLTSPKGLAAYGTTKWRQMFR